MSEIKKNALEVNDVIYVKGHTEFSKCIVERVTKTMAIGRTQRGNIIRFQRNYINGHCFIVGRDTWDTRSAYFANDTYDSLYEKHNLKGKFRSIDVESLSTDKLKRIIAIANEEE